LPSEYRGLSIIHELTGRPPGGEELRRLCSFISLTHASVILLREHTPGDWPPILAGLRIAPTRVGGFAVYKLAGIAKSPGACYAQASSR
jgi:hypothetical protein